METKSNNRGDPETLADAARRLLAGLSARNYRAAGGNGQAAPIFDQPGNRAETRRLGQSEEKNRRQSPQRVADNDNGRKGPREKLEEPQSRDQLRYPGEVDGQRFEMSGLVGGVKRLRFSFKEETATSPNRDDASNTDRAELECSTLPEYAK